MLATQPISAGRPSKGLRKDHDGHIAYDWTQNKVLIVPQPGEHEHAVQQVFAARQA